MSDQKAPVLSARNVTKSYGGSGLLRSKSALTAVDEVSLSLKAGRTLGIVGESGCGKSTLSRMLVGITDATSGDVLIDDKLIGEGSKAERNQRLSAIQMVFQSPAGSLNPRMRIDQILGEPLDIHRRDLSRAERRSLVTAMIERVGLDAALLSRYPHELSGGQQQRVGIARALITNPKVVICDEAVSALDVSVQAQIINLLLEIQNDTGIAYIFISHDLSVIAAIADDIVVMYMGNIVEQGAAPTILSKPAHPYTSLLLQSAFVPDPAIEKSRMRNASTEVRQTIERTDAGCAFRPRCPIPLAICASVKPPLLDTDRGDTQVACHNYQVNPTV